MKLRDIIATATSNMMRSKVRTFLTIIAIFIGAFTITLTIGISSGVSSYIDKQVGSIGAEDVLIVQRKVEIDTSDSGPRQYDPDSKSLSTQAALLNSTLNDSDMAKVSSVGGLRDVKPMLLVTPDYIEGVNGDKYQLDVQQTIESADLDLTAGTKPSNTSNTPEILLTPDFVKPLGFSSDEAAVGKTVMIAVKTPLMQQKTIKVTITGVQQKSILTRGGLFTNDALINQAHSIQTKDLPAEAGERYVGILARFDAAAGDDNLQTIKDNLDAAGYMGRTVDDQIGIIKNIIDAITAVLIFFGAIALLAASFGIINTLFMSVQERTKEIGLMKAMGMSRSRVFLLFSVEAILLGFWGSALGVGAAMMAGKIANQIASDSFLKDLPGFDLTTFPILSTSIVVFVIMFIAFLAGTLPARRAAKQDPITALRYE